MVAYIQNHIAKVCLQPAIDWLRGAADSNMRFGERVRRLFRLAARDRDLQPCGLIRRGSLRLGRVTLIVGEGESLLRRPRRRRS